MNNIAEQLATLERECKNYTARAFGMKAFLELNDLRVRGVEPFIGPKANTAFRKAVICKLMDECNIGVNSAAGHYNYAFKYAQGKYPELVVGLGRPEDKKGGRLTNLERERRAALSL
jgi:hypothetical protein